MKSAVAVMFCLLFLTSALLLPAGAETRYVSDQLVITVREGKAAGAAIVTTLRTGAPVEVLEEDKRHLKVRSRDGAEGYVQKQYISSETPKPVIIARLEKERDRLKARLAQLQNTQAGQTEEAQALKERAAKTEASLARARQELQALTEKYDALVADSGHVVETTSERDRLQGDNERLATELETLREENAQLLRKGMIHWFLAGAGVLLVGWLIGRSSRKKRRGYL